jgi:hypothetical protein
MKKFSKKMKRGETPERIEMMAAGMQKVEAFIARGIAIQRTKKLVKLSEETGLSVKQLIDAGLR